MARRLLAVACCLGLALSLVLVPGVGLAQSGRPALRDLAAMTRRVDLRRTPTVDPSVHRSLPALPRLQRPGTAAPNPMAGGAPRAAVDAAPAPADATSSGAPAATVAHAFAGLDDQNDGACPSPACIEPPDPWVAVGPNDVVQVVNASVRITDRDGGNPVSYSLDSFFDTAAQSPTAFAEGDARILYDSYHQRWVASEIMVDCGDGDLDGLNPPYSINDIAISDTTDPRGGWLVNGRGVLGGLTDFPGLGTSRDKIVQSWNVFALVEGAGTDCLTDVVGYAGTKLLAWNWGLTDVTGIPTIGLAPPANFDTTKFDWRPASAAPALGTDANVYVVGLGANNNDVYYGAITGTPPNQIAMTVRDLTTLNLVDVVNVPPTPGQPPGGSTFGPQTDDGRITDAVWQAGKLWFVSTRECMPAGQVGGTTHDCVRVTKLQTNGTAVPTRLGDFLLSAPDRDTFMGGVGVDGNGTLHVVYSRSSTTGGDFVDSASVYQRATDAATAVSAEAPIAAGASTYTMSAGRWGDYVGVPIDPTDTGSVWQADEYANGSGGWSTRVAQLTVPGGVRRLSGTDRYATGVATSNAGFTAPVPAVFISTGLNFPDALAGAAIAGQLGAPVLLVPAGNVLPVGVAAELRRLQPHDIYVLGSAASVSEGIKTALGAFTNGGTVTRLWGSDRYGTAAAISTWFRTHGTLSTGGHVILATGATFPDALAGGPLAARNGAPILLVTLTTIPATTQAELDALLPSDITILGSAGSVSDAVAAALAHRYFSDDLSKIHRLGGANRYETAALIAAAGDWTDEAWSAPVPAAFVTTGVNFPDALGAAALAGLVDGPIVLVSTTTPLPPSSAGTLGALDPAAIFVFGGPTTVSDAVKAALAAYLVP